MQSTLLDQGVILMLVGMGTVFVFLTALVVGMAVMAAAVRRLERNAGRDAASSAEVAAIAAAIRRHRRR